MDIFDGYLIASDIDGTFVTRLGFHNENYEALNYFKENGGRFTFATGRLVDHLRTPEFKGLINAPAVLANGAAIYDYEKERIVSTEVLDYTLGEFVSEVSPLAAPDTILNFYGVKSLLGPSEDIITTVKLSEADELLKNHPDIRDEKMLKIIVRHNSANDALELKEKTCGLKFFSTTYIGRAWAIGLEFNSVRGTKGASLKKIKEYLPEIHTTIGIGDYENDVTLLRDADIAATVSGCVPELSEIADIKTVSADKAALADLVFKLEEMIKNK